MATASRDRLCFFSGSMDVAPGRGARESVLDPALYAELAREPHWRRALSNFDAGAEFEHSGLHYRTIEHAFQAAKIALVDPAKAFSFSVESGTALGLAADGLAARRMRKCALLPPCKLAEWDAASAGVMRDAARAKYAADPRARRVLAATRDAELWHLVPRGQPARFVHLEEIRAEIRGYPRGTARD